MKRLFLTAAMVSILITQTGCFGSFGLVKTVYEFNDGVSDNGVIKSLLMWALMIVPVYQVAGFLDIVLFNLIEFWTGSNPIAMEEGQIEEQLVTLKGEKYKITATKNKMVFVKYQEGVEVNMGAMVFENSDNSWNFVKEGESTKLASVDLENNVVSVFTKEGIATLDANSARNLAFSRMNNNCSDELAMN